jgi:hypothetical protein
VSAREAEVAEKLEREREEHAKQLAEKPMSRTSSKTARERTIHRAESETSSPVVTSPSESIPASGSAARPPSNRTPSTVRPTFSFANAAGGSTVKSTSPGRPAVPEPVPEAQKEGEDGASSDLPQKMEELTV